MASTTFSVMSTPKTNMEALNARPKPTISCFRWGINSRKRISRTRRNNRNIKKEEALDAVMGRKLISAVGIIAGKLMRTMPKSSLFQALLKYSLNPRAFIFTIASKRKKIMRRLSILWKQ